MRLEPVRERWAWWRRWVVVPLALGLLTSVLVAWGIAWFQPRVRGFGAVISRADDPLLHFFHFTGIGIRVSGVVSGRGDLRAVVLSRDEMSDRVDEARERWCPALPLRGTLPSISVTPAVNPPHVRFPTWLGWPPRAEAGTWQAMATGWPVPCLSMQQAIPESGSGIQNFGAIRVSPPKLMMTIRGVLPVTPMVVPLVANTLMYGAVWFALLRGPGLVRRLWRKRGHCPECGYDLRELPRVGCPECGWGRADRVE